MRDFDNRIQRRQAVDTVAAAGLLAVAAVIALIVWPNSIERLTGIPPSPHVTAPDDLQPASKDDPTSFLAERDQVELRVAEDTTLGEFLHRSRLNKPAQRQQIAAQLGSSDPSAKIVAGTTFRIRLTPAARDVPGTSPPK